MSEMDLPKLKTKVSVGLVPSNCPEGESVFLSFLASKGCLHSLACGLFFPLQSQDYAGGGENCAKARELVMCDYPEAVMGVTGPSVHGAPDI